MAKCENCGKTLEETFLQKMIGTVVKDTKGKKHIVCSSCQKSIGEAELKTKFS